MLSRFSFQEKQLASKAFDHLVSRRGTKMPHTVEDLSATLGVEAKDLRAVLEKLAQQRILRSQQREQKVWYELYHDMFSHSIDDWNTAWKNRMRVRRGVIGAALVGLAGIAVFVVYDFYINKNSTHLRMNLSDQQSYVELWQGTVEAKSWDIFGQRKFIKQTRVKVTEREPDKRLPQWAVVENEAVMTELIGTLPLQERVGAFVLDGQYPKALKIGKDSINDADIGHAKDVVDGLATLQTGTVNELLWSKFATSRRKSLKDRLGLALSIERFAYWLPNKTAIKQKLQLVDAQQKVSAINSIGKL